MNNGKPEGIFTERDYLKKIACNDVDKNLPIEGFMTPNPVSVKPTTSVAKVLMKMRMGRFRHIIVTDEDGLLKSVISIKDLLDFVLDTLSED